MARYTFPTSFATSVDFSSPFRMQRQIGSMCQKSGHAVAVATREELVAVSDHVYIQASPTFSRE